MAKRVGGLAVTKPESNTGLSATGTESGVPASRIRALNTGNVNPDGQYVLYWMTTARRLSWNFGLDHAIASAEKLGRPLVVLETLGCRAIWSCDRFHRFVLPGMAEHKAQFSEVGIAYYPYVEPSPRHGLGLVESLAKSAALIVTDDFPTYFLPKMHAALAGRVDVRVDAVDSNGIWPMHATSLVFTTAHSFRRFLQKNLSPHLGLAPQAAPLESVKHRKAFAIDPEIIAKWPMATGALMENDSAAIAQLPIDHAVGAASFDGGEAVAQQALKRFWSRRYSRYGEHRNDPEDEAASGLSPYLHFGFLSAHQIFAELVKIENWSLASVSGVASGSREGWWGVSPTGESFLDELITWREVGYNFCSHRRDYDQFTSLPAWAQQTMAEHAADRRPYLYSLTELEQAGTHDELWNAAQRQLVVEGRMHNYMRMLWGKKILEWSESPEAALDILIELNNKYAVDGRNPNSYSGIFWVLGRYDRAWGPERPIFGKIRYMSSDNTARKLPVKGYLQKYSRQRTLFG